MDDLQLHGNHLPGSLPESVTNVVLMVTFCLSLNSLSGSMDVLQLRENDLQGSIPESVTNTV